jgi:microcystin-dependent protein
MSSPYIGEVILVGFNFAPTGWAMCNGQLMSIAENDALFNLIGTTYGGDGQTTFALPDLRGRVPISQGQGAGLSNYAIGESGGAETVTITVAQTPQHAHTIDPATLTATAKCKNGLGNQQTPVGNVLAVEAADASLPYGNAAPNANMSSGAVTLSGTVTAGASGGSQPHDNLQPHLVMNYCISLFGVFPSQS